jgi:hypothetical protein
MLASVSPAFAEAEVAYRRQRIEADFGKRHARPVRRQRVIGILGGGRHRNPQ